MGEAREATGRLSAVRLDESVNLIYDTQLGGGGVLDGWGSNQTRRNPAYSWAGKHHTSLVGSLKA